MCPAPMSPMVVAIRDPSMTTCYTVEPVLPHGFLISGDGVTFQRPPRTWNSSTHITGVRRLMLQSRYDGLAYESPGAGRGRCGGEVQGAARATAGEVLRVLLEPARRYRHRSRADGAALRRSHGAPGARHLRYCRRGRREDLRSRSAPRSFPALRRAVEAANLAVAFRDARHHHQHDSDQRHA